MNNYYAIGGVVVGFLLVSGFNLMMDKTTKLSTEPIAEIDCFNGNTKIYHGRSVDFPYYGSSGIHFLEEASFQKMYVSGICVVRYLDSGKN